MYDAILDAKLKQW